MLKQKKSFIQENQYILLAFLATMGTMIIVFLCNQMVPFGDKTILRMDLYHQYGPLFAELYERVTSGDSLIYSWTSGLGSCFLGNYFNYLSSPIGAVILFFGHKNIPEAIAVMILIKAALSASTFTYYLKKSQHNQSYIGVCFGILYAFCGYMLAYYWNVMWLDAMVLLPIVLYGIEKIIDNGKMGTYVTGLALTMFSNYYMSYMICLFSCIYFFYYYITKNERGAVVSEEYKKNHKGLIAWFKNSRFFRSGCIFALGSLAAAGIMAVVLLPVYNILQQCSATSGTAPSEIKTYFNYFDFFANHFASLTTTIRSSGEDVLPNIYCGVLTIILAPLYFFTKSISKKEKLTTLGLLATLYFSFNINILNFVWHGFHFPNDLPYRQSFIYSFFLLIMAYKTFIRLKEFKAKDIGIAGAALLAFVVIVDELTSKNVTAATVVFTIILVILYVLVLTFFKDKRYQTASLAMLLIVCTCSEVIMCDTAALNISVDKTPYVSDYDEFQELKTNLDTIEQGNFYRMELTDLRTRMDNSWYYYNGASVFSSMAYEKLSNLQDDMGMMSNRINSYTYNPQTPVYNMMYSLKYIVNNSAVNVLDSDYYTASVSTEKFKAYKNNYHLPIAYLVDSETENWATQSYMDSWRLEHGSDPFVLQGEYFDMATGAGNPFKRMDISYVTYSNCSPFTEDLTASSFYYEKTTADADGSATFYITPENEGNIYIYFDVSGASSKSLNITTPKGTITHDATQNCILDLGKYQANETVQVNIPFEENSGNVTMLAYTMDNKIFEKGYQKLSDSQLLIEEFDDTYIKGRFTAEEDCLLYTSIPYDEGWNVIIDGEEVSDLDIVQLGEALLAVKVTEGNHTVEFTYKVSGSVAGLVITVFTTLLIALYYVVKRLRKGKSSKFLPAFGPADNTVTEYILLPENKVQQEIKPVIIKQKETPTYIPPKREIISPDLSKDVKKEIIAPPTDKTE